MFIFNMACIPDCQSVRLTLQTPGRQAQTPFKSSAKLHIHDESLCFLLLFLSEIENVKRPRL